MKLKKIEWNDGVHGPKEVMVECESPPEIALVMALFSKEGLHKLMEAKFAAQFNAEVPPLPPAPPTEGPLPLPLDITIGCGYCDERFTTDADLEAHIEKVHAGDPTHLELHPSHGPDPEEGGVELRVVERKVRKGRKAKKPVKPKKAPKPKAPAKKGKPRNGGVRPGTVECPTCHEKFSSPQALGPHRRGAHGYSAGKAAPAPKASAEPPRVLPSASSVHGKATCPECGAVMAPQGLGPHRRLKHGVSGPPKKSALAEAERARAAKHPPPTEEEPPLEKAASKPHSGGRASTKVGIPVLVAAMSAYTEGKSLQAEAKENGWVNPTLISALVTGMVKELGGERHTGTPVDPQVASSWESMTASQRKEVAWHALGGKGAFEKDPDEPAEGPPESKAPKGTAPNVLKVLSRHFENRMDSEVANETSVDLPTVKAWVNRAYELMAIPRKGGWMDQKAKSLWDDELGIGGRNNMADRISKGK